MGYKVNQKIWYVEVEKFKDVCVKLGRQVKCTELKGNFMGLKCWSWYHTNSPSELNIYKFSEFIKYTNIKNTTCFCSKRYTRDEVIIYLKDLKERIHRKNIRLADIINDNSYISKADVLYYFGGMGNLNKELGFTKSGTFDGHIYSKEELISAFKKFVNELGFIPTALFCDEHGKEYNLPNRKTYTNKFGGWANVLHECGYDDELVNLGYVKDSNNQYVLKHHNAQFLINLIYEYIDTFNENPTITKISDYYGMDLHSVYGKFFGSWNKCLESLGIKLNIKQNYTEDELKTCFMNFIKEYDRVPTIQDFNKTGRPSFWVYQQRYGSWAEACMHYGFKPNCRNPEYYMEDGERCDSSYEYDISTWLKSKNISYIRDVPYIDFVDGYNGKMNCDYHITQDDGESWYVEMAGFVKSLNYKDTTSSEEEMYLRKLKYKIKLFNRSGVNYHIIFRDDMKNKSMVDIFKFLDIRQIA